MNCGTGQIEPKPSFNYLKRFYDNFLFSAKVKNMERVLFSAKQLFPMISLIPTMDLEMLDIGGGGGFYSRAFEELGYGNSTYIDLDFQACGFAKRLGVKNVLHGDATQIDYGRKKFNFIMCRHLVEHLIDPPSFVCNILNLLSKNGILLLICPNGNSLEYLAYPKFIRKRLNIIYRSNNFSKQQVIFKIIFGYMLHGIDPPRHLWAITKEGILSLFEHEQYNVTIQSFPLTHLAYSPYYSERSIMDKIYSCIGTKITAKIRGGTHLVAIIKSKKTNAM